MPQAVAVRLPYASKVSLVPAGCFHWPHTDEEILAAWISRVKEPNTYTFLLGDTFDFARGKLRKHIHAYAGDTNSLQSIDEMVKSDIGRLAVRLEPIKDRILGVVEGNHKWLFQDGITSEQYLCQRLKLPYLGDMGILRLGFADGPKSGVRCVIVYLHHSGGTSGGRTHGGDLNALVRQQDVLDADVYILAHTHDTYAKVVPRWRVTKVGEPKVLERDRAFIRAGCFAKELPYAIEKAYPPRKHGWVDTEIHFHRDSRGDTRDLRLSVRF